MTGEPLERDLALLRIACKIPLQTDDYIELLSAADESLAAEQQCDDGGELAAVRKVWNNDARTFVYEVRGVPSSSVKLSTPADNNRSLLITHPHLVLQVLFFSFEMS